MIEDTVICHGASLLTPLIVFINTAVSPDNPRRDDGSIDLTVGGVAAVSNYVFCRNHSHCRGA
jgi:hypothetical protein